MVDYLVNILSLYGATDAFGVPGGVILDFIYALSDKNSKINPHLNYNEQMAGFAACGYAQASGKPSVAYATRGPGFCNMITCIAEAYQESLPIIFITAHGNRSKYGTRFDNNQEIDAVELTRSITKYSATIDKEEDLSCINTACETSLAGRKGPVVLDIATTLWNKEITVDITAIQNKHKKEESRFNSIIDNIRERLKRAKRPVVLIGDGLRHSVDIGRLRSVAEKMIVPILSSRGSQDFLCGINNYFGYIGSHGIRYSNFILSKADYIISIGNRLAFPLESESFNHFAKNVSWTRIDIDKNEFLRKINNAHNVEVEAGSFIDYLFEKSITIPASYQEWLKICSEIKAKLFNSDCIAITDELSEIISLNSISSIYVTDAGNNEFWFSRAFEKVQKIGIVLSSKSFGTTGSALGKAIGAYYATRKPITCVIGDQGFQFNLQELSFISQWKLPIEIVIINNSCSGMIADLERKRFGSFVHVSSTNGYNPIDIKGIAGVYKISYTNKIQHNLEQLKLPVIIELKETQEEGLIPFLPKGNQCQKMEPLLPDELYDYLEKL